MPPERWVRAERRSWAGSESERRGLGGGGGPGEGRGLGMGRGVVVGAEWSVGVTGPDGSEGAGKGGGASVNLLEQFA